MRKCIFAVLTAMSVCVLWAFTPTPATNSFVRNGVTYVQRGGLGTKDYVVTNVEMSAFVAGVSSVNSKTGDVVLVATDVGALPDNSAVLITNTNFKTAVESVSPPAILPEKWALANVTNKTGGAVTYSDVGALKNIKEMYVEEQEWTDEHGVKYTNLIITIENKLRDTALPSEGTNDYSRYVLRLPAGTVGPNNEGDEASIALVNDRVQTGQFNFTNPTNGFGYFAIYDSNGDTEICSDKLIVSAGCDEPHVIRYPTEDGTFAIVESTVPLVTDTDENKTAVTIGTRNGTVGKASLANGNSVDASGMYSHAEGFFTKAQGQTAHAEGVMTKATNNYAHAEGNGTTAGGLGSHAEGLATTASGNFAFTAGYGASATSQTSFVWQGMGADETVIDESTIANLTNAENRVANGYTDHGAGTFNINPAGGADGFYIGGNSLQNLLDGCSPDHIAISSITNADGTAFASGGTFTLGWQDVQRNKPLYKFKSNGELEITSIYTGRGDDFVSISPVGVITKTNDVETLNMSWGGIVTVNNTLSALNEESNFAVKSIAVKNAITLATSSLETKQDASAKLNTAKTYAEGQASTAQTTAIATAKTYTDTALANYDALKLGTADKTAYQDANGGYYSYSGMKKWIILNTQYNTSNILDRVNATNWHANATAGVPYCKLNYDANEQEYLLYISGDDDDWNFVGDADGTDTATELDFGPFMPYKGFAKLTTGTYQKTKQVAYTNDLSAYVKKVNGVANNLRVVGPLAFDNTHYITILNTTADDPNNNSLCSVSDSDAGFSFLTMNGKISQLLPDNSSVLTKNVADLNYISMSGGTVTNYLTFNEGYGIVKIGGEKMYVQSFGQEQPHVIEYPTERGKLALVVDVTNKVNEVKSQFWDEPMQINWTMKMVNGEMKLYATTNVNMSTL